MAQIQRLEELRDEWRDQVEVVVMEKTHADEFGVGGSPGHITDAGSALEISTARAAWETASMEAARRLAERANHPYGTRRDDFWSEVLAPLARLSSEVVVLDRYLFQRLLEKNASGGSGADDHVCWLLEQLDTHMPRGSRVTLIANDGAPQNRPDRLATPTIEDPDGLSWHYRQGSRAVESVLAAEGRVLDHRNHGVTRAPMLDRQ